MMRDTSLTIYTDGGARGNPGPAGIGVVLLDNKTVVQRLKRFLGTMTNNAAEYEAVIFGLEAAKARGATRVTIYLDSELVASQLRREFKVKNPDLADRFVRAWNLMVSFQSVTIHHIPREENRDADRLVNDAINEALLG